MFESLDGLIRVLMAGAYPVGGRDVIMFHVLDFLNSFESFKPVREERKLPEWLTMYNYLCLLNLPDAIDLLGPLRLNYEGSSEGEGFIPMVKPLLSQGMRKNWQYNLARRYFRKRAMKLVIRDAHVFIGSTNGHDPPSNQVYNKKMFQKYLNWEQVTSKFNRGLPLSLVVLRNGFLGAVVDDRDSWLFVPVVFGDFVRTVSGLHYFCVHLFERNLAGGVNRRIVNMGMEAEFQAYVLLLPLLTEKNYIESESNSWTLVGAEYERLSTDATLHGVYTLPIHLQNGLIDTVTVNGMQPEQDQEMDETTDMFESQTEHNVDGNGVGFV